MISKQQFKDWLETAKDYTLEQMSRANRFFWGKMALWMPKISAYSEQKAIKCNALKIQSPPPVKLEPTSSLPSEVVPVFNNLLEQAHQSHQLLQQINNKIIILESRVQFKKNDKPKLVPVPSKGEPVNQISVELANELRVYLESHDIFQEQFWLNLWLENPNPCDFAERLLTKYPPLETCEAEIYDGIAAWLTKASANKVELIIPKINEEYNNKLHELVGHRPVKGRANRVLEIKRLGLRCNDKVSFKAQVVCS